ncbi:GNAT family N-acetyltransferase [Marinifaba aquimaris]|uniref:GNAT family N-acetyltransferase n=1 Tax=Marinifaba aquimaris TaxID=2741323 RepID=UPI001C2D094B|nr:GNAT family N-acetyltransferase [Marinifaba aquimaris]
MLESPRLLITSFRSDNAKALLQYYLDNWTYLAPFEPTRPANYFSLDNFNKMAKESEKNFKSEQGFQFILFSKQTQSVIGICSFTGVVKGPFQACYLGYSIAKNQQNQGLMTEALEVCCQYIFQTIGLNRIMANYLPDNLASERLLTKLGFEKEGYAKRYLQIAGQWQDHVLTAKLNDSCK